MLCTKYIVTSRLFVLPKTYCDIIVVGSQVNPIDHFHFPILELPVQWNFQLYKIDLLQMRFSLVKHYIWNIGHPSNIPPILVSISYNLGQNRKKTKINTTDNSYMKLNRKSSLNELSLIFLAHFKKGPNHFCFLKTSTVMFH